MRETVATLTGLVIDTLWPGSAAALKATIGDD